MYVCLWVLAALAVCALLLHVAKGKPVRPVFARIPFVPCVVLLAVMAVCTLFSGKNTNSPPAGVMSPILPHTMGGTPVPVVVTPEDIARGHRLESVTTNDAVSYAMPTNVISLVSRFVDYTLTNHLHFTVGITNEPPLRFSIGCQDVFFLNDANFLEGACPSNRPERIRPVTLNLTGPMGTNGTARLSVEGDATPVLFHIVGGVTNRVAESTEISLAVTNNVSYTASYTIYVSCPNLGTGTITATFTPSVGLVDHRPARRDVAARERAAKGSALRFASPWRRKEYA